MLNQQQLHWTNVRAKVEEQLSITNFFIEAYMIEFNYSTMVLGDHWHPSGASSTRQSGFESDRNSSPVCLRSSWSVRLFPEKFWSLFPAASQVSPSWQRSWTNRTRHRNPNLLWRVITFLPPLSWWLLFPFLFNSWCCLHGKLNSPRFRLLLP